MFMLFQDVSSPLFFKCSNNEQNKTYTPFLSHIIFAAIIHDFNWNYFVMCSNTIRRAWVGLL